MPCFRRETPCRVCEILLRSTMDHQNRSVGPTIFRVAVILFVFLDDVHWKIHLSQAALLPIEMQSKAVVMRMTVFFCPGNDNSSVLMSSPSKTLCYHLQNNNLVENSKCYPLNETDTVLSTTEAMCSEVDQQPHCVFADAFVCKYADGAGSCVYSTSPSDNIFCICKEDGSWPTISPSSKIKSNCSDNLISRTTRRSLTHYITTGGQTTESLDNRISEVNIAAIVLGIILATVLLVLLAVRVLKRRRDRTPTNKSSNTTDRVRTDATRRAQMPDPLVLGGTEFNYAYDHWPQSNPASDPGKPKPVNRYEENESSGISSITAGNSSETIEVPKYYEVGQTNDGRKGGETPQGPKYYAIGQASYAAKSQENLQAPKYDEVRRRPHTEQENNEKTPRDPNYFELEQLSDSVNGGKTPQAPKYDEVRRGHHTEQNSFEKTPQSPKYDEVRRRPHTEQSSNEKTPQDSKYFELEHPQDNDTETMFIEVDGSANPSPGGFSNKGYDQAYMPLKQTAKPAESGYEPLKLPPPTERNDDASSPYDHLNNKTGIRSQTVKSPEKEDDDQYASLNI